MAGREDNNRKPQVWSASYAGVEVFQQLHNNTAVMLRRKDSFVNVTQILKCAQYDKPQRTRFLEREIHTGLHEKIQGGYGKYQGTWVPLSRAISLAQELNIFESLRPLFEYNPGPGDSTPTAPRSLEAMTKRKVDGNEGRPAKAKRRSKGTLSDILNQPDVGSSQTRLAQQEPPRVSTPQSTTLPVIDSWAGGSGGVGYNTPNSQPRPNASELNVHGYRGHLGSGTLPLAPPVYMGATATPENNRTAYAGGRPPWPPTPRDSHVGNTPVVSRVLRDISNTHLDNSGAGNYQFAKHAPRPEAAMLTPPASAGRRGVAPLQQRPPMPDTPTYSRPPAGNAGYAGNSREFSRVPIVSADHSRSVSNGSQQQQQQQQQPSLLDDGVALVLGFLSRPAAGPAGSEHVPAAVEETILSDRGFDPNAEVGGERTTLLHVATRHGHWGAVRLLLQRGADAARPSRDGTTALMLAASQPLAYAARQARVFEWLLDAFEAALIKRDKKGRTAVHWVSLAGAHEPAALYYSTLLVRKLASRQLIEVVSWCDYLGCSASKLAVDCGLLRVADVLQQAAAQAASAALERSGSSASTVSLNSTGSAPAVAAAAMPSSLARRGGGDRYEAAARRASGLVCAAIDDMRREHQQQRRAIDADTEYAAQLLLELRSERDAACADADAYAAVAQQCDVARHVEDTMRRRVEQTVGLQHVARTSKLVQEASSSSSSSSSPVAAARPATTAGAPERLLAEYAMLRARAADYEHSSRVLGREYAELASVVRPWATPGGSGGGGGGDDEAEDTAALCVVLQAEEQRLHKLERVVAAACGDLTLDRVRTVVGPVLSVLNSGATK